MVRMLSRIFSNIQDNLMDDKYRTLKKSNNKIAELTSHQEVVQILRHGGFVEIHPGYVLQNVNLSQID